MTATTRVAGAAAPVSQLPALTGIRFFAAAYVVFYHFVFPALETRLTPLRNLAGHGYSAVSFFFVLSGFVLSYTYLQPGSRPVDRRRFWMARFSRIYPAYVLAFLIAAPFQIQGSLSVNAAPVATAKLTVGAGLYLTLLQAWTPWTAWYWNIPAWSLSVEAFLYGCFPFVASRIIALESRQCVRWAMAMWILALAVPSIYAYASPVSGHYPIPMAQLAIETNPLLHLPEFVLGVLVGRIFSRGTRLSAGTASVLSIAALGLLILLLAVLPPSARTLISNGLTAPVSAVLIFALAHQTGGLAAVLGLAPLRLLGEASYALYILQYPIAYLFDLNEETVTLWRFLPYFVTAVATSVVVFLYIETPLRRRLMATAARPAIAG